MILGSILNPINSSIIAVALVPIGVAFGAPATQTALLVSSLYFATVIGQPLAGRLVDISGPRGIYLVGAALTIVAGAIGTFAPDLTTLIVARVVLGLGTCAGYPAAMTLLHGETDRIRDSGRSHTAGMLTALSIANQTVAVIGPALGGVLVDLGGWQYTFAINVPLGIACLVLGLIALPKPRSAVTGQSSMGLRGTLIRVDILGIVLFSGTLVALMLFLTNVRIDTLWLCALSIAMCSGFAFWQMKASAPFIDLRVIGGNVPLLLSFLRGLLTMIVAYTMFFGFPQWLQQEREFNATTTGLFLLPTFATAIIAAAVAGKRLSVRGKLVIGATAQIVGCAGMLAVTDGTSAVVLLAITTVFGIPQGLLNLANQNAVFRQANPAHLGSSAGLLRTFMYFGAILASAAIGIFFQDTVDTNGLHGLSGLMLGIAVVLLLLTVADRSLRRLEAQSP